MEADIEILHLNALAYDIVHLCALIHSAIEHRVEVGVVRYANRSQLGKLARCDEHGVIVLLNLRREAAVNRSNAGT